MKNFLINLGMERDDKKANKVLVRTGEKRLIGRLQGKGDFGLIKNELGCVRRKPTSFPRIKKKN